MALNKKVLKKAIIYLEDKKDAKFGSQNEKVIGLNSNF